MALNESLTFYFAVIGMAGLLFILFAIIGHFLGEEDDDT